MKTWDELTKRQQDNFIRKHADEIFVCSVHNLAYKTDVKTMLCKECRDLTRTRYGIYSAK